MRVKRGRAARAAARGRHESVGIGAGPWLWERG